MVNILLNEDLVRDLDLIDQQARCNWNTDVEVSKLHEMTDVTTGVYGSLRGRAAQDEMANLLMKMIAKEMATALLNPDSDVDCDETSTPEQSDPTTNFHNMDALADTILSVVTNISSPSVNTDRELRRMLREGIEEEGTESETVLELTCSEKKIGQSSYIESKTTISSEPNITLTSAVKLNRTVPMDIWHPDYWSKDLKDIEPKLYSSDCEKKTLGDLLNSVDDICSSSYAKHDNDNHSVSTELSELSGVLKEEHASHSNNCAPVNPSRSGSAPRPTAAAGISPIQPSSRVVKSVTFRDVTVRNYKRILGDNPACTNGPSIGIGWEFTEMEARDLEDWEMECRRLRTATDLMMSRKEREAMLYSLGYSSKDIAAAIRVANKVRAQRRTTVGNLTLEKLQLKVENAKTLVKRIATISWK